MTFYLDIVPILASFFVALLLMPYWINRAKKNNLIGKDIHKAEKTEVAEAGGVVVMAGFALGTFIFIGLNTFILKAELELTEIFAMLSAVFLISFIAFTDDILGWKIGLRKRTRLLLVALSSMPLIVINAGKSSIGIPLLGNVDLGLFYPLVLIPIGIVGATTTFNLLAGYNGLEAGLGVLLLSATGIVAYFTGNPWLSLINFCFVASLLAFLKFNFYPAKVFPGDTLTYGVGSVVAISAILGNFEKIAVFFFIPYIIETFLKLRGKLKKESFSQIDNDGFLHLKEDKIYSLNHVAILFLKSAKMRPNEKRVVYFVWAFQLFIIILGFIILKEGIFLNVK